MQHVVCHVVRRDSEMTVGGGEWGGEKRERLVILLTLDPRSHATLPLIVFRLMSYDSASYWSTSGPQLLVFTWLIRPHWQCRVNTLTNPMLCSSLVWFMSRTQVHSWQYSCLARCPRSTILRPTSHIVLLFQTEK